MGTFIGTALQPWGILRCNSTEFCVAVAGTLMAMTTCESIEMGNTAELAYDGFIEPGHYCICLTTFGRTGSYCDEPSTSAYGAACLQLFGVFLTLFFWLKVSSFLLYMEMKDFSSRVRFIAGLCWIGTFSAFIWAISRLSVLIGATDSVSVTRLVIVILGSTVALLNTYSLHWWMRVIRGPHQKQHTVCTVVNLTGFAISVASLVVLLSLQDFSQAGFVVLLYLTKDFTICFVIVIRIKNILLSTSKEDSDNFKLRFAHSIIQAVIKLSIFLLIFIISLVLYMIDAGHSSLHSVSFCWMRHFGLLGIQISAGFLLHITTQGLLDRRLHQSPVQSLKVAADPATFSQGGPGHEHAPNQHHSAASRDHAALQLGAITVKGPTSSSLTNQNLNRLPP